MSSRLKSLERRNIAFAVLSLLLLVAIVLRPSRSSGVDEESLDKLFPDFVAGDARIIKIYEGGTKDGDEREIVLTRDLKGIWVVTTQSGYPIVEGREERLLGAIENLRVRKLVTTRQETFEEYAGATGWTEVTVLAAGNKPLADIAIGKTARYPELYMRVGKDDDARIVQTLNLTRDMASTEVSRWVEPRLFENLLAENVIRVDIEQPAFSRKAVLGRKGAAKTDVGMTVPAKDEGEEAQAWALLAPTVADADSEKVEDLIRSFTGVRLAGIAAGKLTDERRTQLGFDQAEALVTVKHRDVNGAVTTHKLTVGGKSEDGTLQYVMVEGRDWVYEVAPYQLADFKRDTGAYEVKPPEPPAEEDDGKDGDDAKEAAGSPDGKEAAGSPDGDDGQPKPVEPPALETYEVVLKAVGDKEADVLKAVRAATGLGLAEVKALVEGLPATLKTGLTKAEADEMAGILEALGADVEVKASE